jgi:hypothetical protein
MRYSALALIFSLSACAHYEPPNRLATAAERNAVYSAFNDTTACRQRARQNSPDLSDVALDGICECVRRQFADTMNDSIAIWLAVDPVRNAMDPNPPPVISRLIMNTFPSTIASAHANCRPL